MTRLILVGGGSSSGKSYVTDKVINNIGIDKVTKITIDDYYKDQTNMPMEERIKENYDHPKAFDWKLMRKQIDDLRDGKSIEKPVYDYKIHNRSSKVEIIQPKELVIVEGIMALVDKKLRDMAHLKVFIKASPEVRFLRRFIRDHLERKRSYENIVSQYLKTVAPMYKEIVEPSSNYADIIVNNDDGVANASIEVLTCVFKNELIMATDGIDHMYHANNEFTEELLSSVFSKE
ncbi:MAG: uridine kinase [Candidatus Enterosoma sp.]|nr:uridine kinase [bacterium]MDY3907433.1 uridine kinase [Candidatus Enterosoma sp.]MDY5866127.1 uridine kinase [Candidatus Enterosoma sp.]